jgi:hypothetical protein
MTHRSIGAHLGVPELHELATNVVTIVEGLKGPTIHEKKTLANLYKQVWTEDARPASFVRPHTCMIVSMPICEVWEQTVRP